MFELGLPLSGVPINLAITGLISTISFSAGRLYFIRRFSQVCPNLLNFRCFQFRDGGHYRGPAVMGLFMVFVRIFCHYLWVNRSFGVR